MSRNGAPLLVPNQINIMLTYSDGPMAHPVVIQAMAPDGIRVAIAGGLTKEEQIAALIAPFLPVQLLGTEQQEPENFDQAIASRSLDMASAILTESARRRAVVEQQAKEAQQSGKIKVADKG